MKEEFTRGRMIQSMYGVIQDLEEVTKRRELSKESLEAIKRRLINLLDDIDKFMLA